jgi:hypothetical protein
MGRRHAISFAGSKAALATYILLGFPLLVLLAASGVIARSFRWGLGRLLPDAEKMKAAVFLAASRLAVSTTIAISLLIAASTSLGLFVYSQSMVSSLGSTAQAKASVFTGGDASVAADFGYAPPRSFPLPSSSIEQITSAASVGNQPIGLLVIDPKTFARAALWNNSFSSTPLAAMMRDLQAARGPNVSMVAVGSTALQNATSISLQGVQINVQSVAAADAFPGIYGDTPWMVVGGDQIQSAVENAGGTNPLSLGGVPDLIVKGDPQKATLALEALGFTTNDILTTNRILQQPTYIAAQSTLKVLRALGIAAGLLSVLAILLYLQVRQRERSLANALSARMGMKESQHLIAVAVELGAILTLASVIALGGGFFVTSLTHAWLDPVPGVPPPPLLTLPLVLIPILIVAASLIAFAGGSLAQWSSHRADLAEEMRRVG